MKLLPFISKTCILAYIECRTLKFRQRNSSTFHTTVCHSHIINFIASKGFNQFWLNVANKINMFESFKHFTLFYNPMMLVKLELKSSQLRSSRAVKNVCQTAPECSTSTCGHPRMQWMKFAWKLLMCHWSVHANAKMRKLWLTRLSLHIIKANELHCSLQSPQF